jgi:hypothetical protein
MLSKRTQDDRGSRERFNSESNANWIYHGFAGIAAGVSAQQFGSFGCLRFHALTGAGGFFSSYAFLGRRRSKKD